SCASGRCRRVADLLASRDAADADWSGYRVATQFCRGMEQLLSPVDRAQSGRALSLNPGPERMEQRQQRWRRRKTVLPPDCARLVYQCFAINCGVYSLGQVLARRIDGGGDEMKEPVAI